MNRSLLRAALAVAVAGGVAATTVVAAQGQSGGQHHRTDSISARLSGFNEDPAVVSTPARGSFKARVDKKNQTITYRLAYEGLEGPVTQAHLHFGGRHQSGGISVWLCGTAALPGPAGTPMCPAEGAVTGTATATSVVGPAGQGIAAGEFNELVKAIRAGVVYANVHSELFPGGEIRGQVR
jgi:hypothetical protein